jgi:hypothetical protein
MGCNIGEEECEHMGKETMLAVVLLLWTAAPGAQAAPAGWSKPEPVRIEGYAGEAMEPFLSRDGATLFFNTRNDPESDTDIHFARRHEDLTFVHQGVLQGTKSRELDGVPTMARDGTFCFISPRDYRQTLNSVFCGHFNGNAVVDVAPQMGLKSARLGRLIFDVELSADGHEMVFAEGTFSGGAAPDDADLYLGERDGNGFVRSGDGARVMKRVNSDALEYAPSLSADGLELFFTRLTGFWIFRQAQIFRSTRRSAAEPFSEPVRVPLDGFVEGPSSSADGRSLYFHKLVEGRFGIWRITRP